jgi:hypothetical protein
LGARRRQNIDVKKGIDDRKTRRQDYTVNNTAEGMR